MMQMQGGSMCTLGLPLTVKSRSFTCPVRIAHGLSTANPSRWRGHIILLSEMIPTPNAAVRLINRLKLLIDDTPTLSNAKKALWGWAAGEYDETQTRKKVEKLISQNKVIVFGASFSLFSSEARNLLNGLGAKVKYVDLDKLDGKEGVHFFHVLSKVLPMHRSPYGWYQVICSLHFL
eukprot:jgi/Botrbrau1/12580/Bobra.0169s0111.2